MSSNTISTIISWLTICLSLNNVKTTEPMLVQFCKSRLMWRGLAKAYCRFNLFHHLNMKAICKTSQTRRQLFVVDYIFWIIISLVPFLNQLSLESYKHLHLKYDNTPVKLGKLASHVWTYVFKLRLYCFKLIGLYFVLNSFRSYAIQWKLHRYNPNGQLPTTLPFL